MSNRRFTPRQVRFLELYFSGCKIKTAARAAGYWARSDQALCNRGRRILDKFGRNPLTLLLRAGPRGLNIARLIKASLDGDNEQRRLATLKILGQVYFS